MTEEQAFECAIKRFSEGDRVCFNDRSGLIVGIIAKINKKSISIKSEPELDNTLRVTPDRLRLIARA